MQVYFELGRNTVKIVSLTEFICNEGSSKSGDKLAQPANNKITQAMINRLVSIMNLLSGAGGINIITVYTLVTSVCPSPRL